jgi:nucleoside-diphosphate-sugar epimerase
MRVVLIGGTGHVGTYLVPRLVEAGHSLTVITRGQRKPYRSHGAWETVQFVTLDRTKEEQAGTFGTKIRDLRPEAVIDMICFTEGSAQHLVDALRGQVQFFLHCSTVWVHGHATQIPVSEEALRKPIGEYGIRKAAIEAYLLSEAHRTGFPATCILPGHIVGPGWVPLNPAGNFNPVVYSRLGRGEEVSLPNQGTDIVHHVHADDVAQLFVRALTHWNAAYGESFHAVSPSALTLRGYAEAVAGWFGQPVRLKFQPFDAWKETVSAEDADSTWAHLEHSPNCYSISKAQRLLGYQPRYTSLEAIYESVQVLLAQGVVKV